MYQDLTNKRFGKLLVIAQAPTLKNKSFRWFCKCDCGKELKVKSTSLIDGITTSCGCEYGKPKKGLRFGKLEITDLVVENNHTLCICLCDCGNYTKQRFSSLKRGDVKSCGCLGKEMQSKGKPVHGLYYTRIYKIYRGMVDRCLCKTSPHYSDWGGRGITICDEWIGKNGFINFYNWSKSNGYSDELSIDRIENDGNYCPENCRWATAVEQQNNTRKNLIVVYRGEKLTLSQASRKIGLSTSTIWHRIQKYGNNLDIALKEPIRHELSRYK